MKKLLLQTIACCAVLLPVSNLEAATFGGFKPGYKFKLKVDTKVTAKSVGTKISTGVPVPKGLPDYKKGQIITFTIGNKGQLTAKNLSIPYSKAGTSSVSNAYIFVKTGTTTTAHTGTVFKNGKGKPTGANANFQISTYKGFDSTSTTVTYTFEPVK